MDSWGSFSIITTGFNKNKEVLFNTQQMHSHNFLLNNNETSMQTYRILILGLSIIAFKQNKGFPVLLFTLVQNVQRNSRGTYHHHRSGVCSCHHHHPDVHWIKKYKCFFFHPTQLGMGGVLLPVRLELAMGCYFNISKIKWKSQNSSMQSSNLYNMP